MENQQFDKYWPDTLALLKENLTEATFDSMVKKLEPIEVSGNEVLLKTENAVYKSIIEKRYLSEITRAIQISSGKQFDVRIVTSDDLQKELMHKNAPDSADPSGSLDSHLNSKYIFETFVPGNSNAMAYALALSVADEPGSTSYNPLFLYGGVGLGKTHLMHSIGNRILQRNPDFKVLYCSAEAFVNEFITALGRNRNSEFRRKYRGIDVLLIDDIQFLFEKERSQEEFFHTFNALRDASKQIVISSDQPPKELKTLEDRISSRLSWGLVVDVKLPDFETRTAILEKKADMENITISKEVTKFIAKSIASNIRDLEGALNKVCAYAKLSKSPITMDLAERAIADLISDIKKPKLSVEYIQEIVAMHYNITIEELCGKRRTANLTFPRHVAMYLSRKLIDMSLPDIGAKFDGRDHSTVIHGCNKITDEIEKDPDLKKIVIELEKKIMG